MKELTARHPSGQMTIVQRFQEGSRFIKVTPTNLIQLYFNNFKETLKDKPFEVSLGSNGWIRIKKLGRDKKMEEALEKGLKETGVKEEDIDEDYVLNKEAEMFKGQGFIVEVKEI